MSGRPVVVGTDGSPAARAAVDWAVDEAARRGLPLRIVHAAAWAHFESPSRPLADRVTYDAGARARARRPDAAVATDVLLRDPVPGLLDEGESAALLVLGSRALGPVAGALLGSVSLPVVARAPCPVVVVRDAPRPAGDRGPVVLGVGDHGEAVAAAAFALTSAVARGCAVRAVHAWRAPRAEGATAHTGRSDGARHFHRARARQRLDDVMATVRGAAPEIETVHVLNEGRAPGVLLAASAGAALLVVGVSRRGGHAGRRLGPVHRAVLRHAPCPVAVVPHT